VRLALGVSFLLFAGDALAWGLQTHLFLAQHASLEPLVLAGACLPDLSLIGRVLGTPAFGRAHQWATLRRLAACPRSEADRALALGYATHLVCDVVAHNRFVPEYEARIARLPHAVHALAEWGMDHHVRGRLLFDPHEVLVSQEEAIVQFVAHGFRCAPALARRAVELLARADGFLRASPAPAICRGALRLVVERSEARLEGYLDDALLQMRALPAALDGRLVDWLDLDPEGRAANQGAKRRTDEHIARVMQAEHHP
jgi:hypothetical protein